MLTPQTSERTCRARKAALATGSSNLNHTTMLFWRIPKAPRPSFSSSQTLWRVIPDVFKGPLGAFLWLPGRCWFNITRGQTDSGNTGRMKSFYQRCSCLMKQTNKQKSNLEKRLLFKDNCVTSVRERVHVRVCVCVSQTALHSSAPCSFFPENIHREMAFVDLPIKKRHFFLTSYIPLCQSCEDY